MFVFSVKTTKKQLISMLICVVMLIAIIVVAVLWPAGEATAQTFKPVKAADGQQRVAYLKTLGYDAELTSEEVKEVLIPDEFDEVFTAYNELQEKGMDFEPYHGKRLKCWTYVITNYPAEDNVVANLYVYEDKIVGGDVRSTASDGFMHGLKEVEGVVSATG